MIFNLSCEQNCLKYSSLEKSSLDEQVRDRDTLSKYQSIVYLIKKGKAKEYDLLIGYSVVPRKKDINKFSTPFHPNPFILVDRKCSGCSVKSNEGVLYRGERSYVNPFIEYNGNNVEKRKMTPPI